MLFTLLRLAVECPISPIRFVRGGKGDLCTRW